MGNVKRIRELKGPWLVRVSGSWVAMWRRYVWVDGKGRKAKLKKRTLGRVDRMTREEAEYEIEKIRNARRTSKTPADDVTVRQFYQQHYLPEHIEKLSKAGQNQLISTFGNYILPNSALGDVRLQAVTLGLLQQHCDMIYEAGKISVEKVKFALSGMFRRAKAHRLIDHNPASEILLPRNIQHRELRAPTLEEVRPLIAVPVQLNFE